MKHIRSLSAMSAGALILGLGAALPAAAAPIVEDDPAYLTIHKYTSPVVRPPLPNDGGKLDDDAMAILEDVDGPNGSVPGVIFTAEQALSYGPFCYVMDDVDEIDLFKSAGDCDVYGIETWGSILLGSPASLDFWRRASYLADGTWDRNKLNYASPIHGVTSADGAIGFDAGDGQWMSGASLGMTGGELNGTLVGGSVVTKFDLGLYRVTETYAAPEVSKSDPFFITLPVTLQDDVMIDTDLIKLGDWNYDVHVYPKNHVQDLKKTHEVDDEPVGVGGLITYSISLTKPESVNHKICYNVSASPIAVLSAATEAECDNWARDNAPSVSQWLTRAINHLQFEDHLPPGLVLPTDPKVSITITPPPPGSSYLWDEDYFNVISDPSDPGYLNVMLSEEGLFEVNKLGVSDTITLTFNALVASAGIGTDGIMTNVATGTYKWDSVDGRDEFSYTTPPDVAYYGGERILKRDISHKTKELQGAEFMLFNECVGNATVCPDGAKTYAIAYGKDPVALASDYCSLASIAARTDVSLPVCFYNAMDVPTGYVNISDTAAKGTEYQRELVSGALTSWHVKGSLDAITLPPVSDLQVTSTVFLDAGTYSATPTYVAKAATDAHGAVLFNGINWKPADGPKDMVILETKAPAGYELLAEPMIITIDSTIGDATTGGTWNTTVFNAQKNAGFPIPLTGGTGSMFLTVAGLIGFVAVVIVTSRKRETA